MQLSNRFLIVATAAVAMTAIAFAASSGKLQTNLTGAPINGVTPTGDARIHDITVRNPGELEIRTKQVNLPSGTVLNVVLDGTTVGTLTVSRREAEVEFPLSQRATTTSTIAITMADGTVILNGGPFGPG